MPKVFDVFPFYNEELTLRIHMKELFDVVDHFVMVEGSRTHTGHPKPFYFDEHRHMFEVGRKLVSRQIELSAAPCEPSMNWGREVTQRSALNGILAELGAQDDDIVITGDVDEIPKAGIVSLYGDRQDICSIEMPTYHYNLNTQLETPTVDPKICRYRDVKREGVNNIRYYHTAFPVHTFRNAGWHLSFMGGVEKVVDKLKAYAHYDDRDPKMSTYVSRENVEESIRDAKSVYLRPDIKYSRIRDFTHMPRYIIENFFLFLENGWIVDPPKQGEMIGYSYCRKI